MSAPRERPILFSGTMIRAILNGSKTQTRRVVTPQPTKETSRINHAGTHISTGKSHWCCLGDTYGAGVPCRDGHSLYTEILCPYGAPGDRLWVRETWQYADWTEDGQPYVRYAADEKVRFCEGAGEGESLVDVWAKLSAPENYDIDLIAADRRWRPSIFMPRWASRITLKITDVRVERLQKISEEDAVAEGCVAGEPMTEVDIELMRGTEGYELAKALGVGSYPSARFNYSMLWDDINGKRAPWHSNPWVWAVTFKPVSIDG